MSLQDILLSTRIETIPKTSVNIFKEESKQDIPHPPENQKEITSNISNENRDYIKELKDKLIKYQIGRWLNSKNENKQFFSATEISECPKQTWYKLKGKITYEMLDINKFFYLLDIYGRMGDTVHNYIYDKLKFDSTEVYMKDLENCVSGRYDIYDNGNIIDIKSSQNITDVSKQLSIYYFLITEFKKLKVNKVMVWWVLKDKMIEYDINKLKEIYPKLINRAKKLKESLKEETFPESLGIDEDSCKYCPIESWCKGIKPKEVKEESNPEIKEKPKNSFDDILVLV